MRNKSKSLSAPCQEWRLPTRHLGRRVLVYKRVDSTNNIAAALADDPTNDGLAILADQQTAGRGQHGRRWHCPQGAGVLLSVLLFPPAELRRPVLLAAWAAVAVCDTVRQTTGLPPRIKWPNDVLVHGRKVCGILIEQSRGTVVGIGLNVKQSAETFAAAGLPLAGSLQSLAGQTWNRDAVARLLLSRLDAEYTRLLQGDHAPLQSAWCRDSGLLGQWVTVQCHDATHCGRLEVLSWDGLELVCADGDRLCLLPERVQHVVPLAAEEVNALRGHAQP